MWQIFLHSHNGWEGISFMWKMTFDIFITSLRFETPWIRKSGFYDSVCLSVCLPLVGCILDNSRYNYQIELSLCTLYRSRKSKDKFVNQPYPTKIKETRPFFVFLKKSKILILVFDCCHKSLQIIFIKFFN